MSINRLFSVFVVLAVLVAVVLTVRAGSAASEVASSPKAVLDQFDRHPSLVSASEQARLEFRRGEWYAGQAAVALDQFDRHPSLISSSAKVYEPTENAQSAQPAYDAEAARWVALGEFYGQLRAAQDADTARWVAMGKFYAKLEVERSQRVQEAEAARWTAMAKFYAKLHTKPFFSTNKGQNSTDNTLDQQARDAIQVRWQAEHGGANRTCVLLCGGQ